MNREKPSFFKLSILIVAVLATAVFTCTGTGTVLAEGRILATITVIDGGGAQIRRSGASEWAPASEEMELFKGDSIKTDKVSKVEVQLPDNSIIRISELSNMTFGVPATSGVKLDIDQGQMWCKLKKLEAGEEFEVVTPQVTAGVRGTTFWVDAQNPDEHVIGVEDGQVEAMRGQNRVMLQRQMRIAAMKGRLAEADRFDPEKRQRWEQFTNRIVTERLERFRDVVGEYRDNAIETTKTGAALVKNVGELDRKTRTLVVNVETTVKKQERLTQETDNVVEKVKKAMKTKQARVKKNQLRKLSRKVDKLIKTSGEVFGDFKSSRENFTTHFQTVQEYLHQTRELNKKIATLKKQQDELKRKTERNRRRREFDPDWPKLQKIQSAIDNRVSEVIENTERSEKILSRVGDATQDKAVTLIEHTEQLKNYIDENKAKIVESVKSLGQTHAKLAMARKAIDKELNK